MTRQALQAVIASLVVVGTAAAGIAMLPSQADASQSTGDPAVDGQFVSAADIAATAPRGQWNSTTGSGVIILDDSSYFTVFQGEDDIESWRDTSDTDVSGTVLEGEVGKSEGDTLTLQSSVPASQDVGRYSSSGLTVRVQEPRISKVTLLNQNGAEIGSNVSVRKNNPVLVKASWNFAPAEDIQLELVDQNDGITVEREVLATSPSDAQAAELPSGFATAGLSRKIQGLGTTGYETAYWLLNFDSVDEGAYTLRIEGSDNLTSGEATWSTELTVGEESTPTATPTEMPTDTPTATPTNPTTTPEPTPTDTEPVTTASPTEPTSEIPTTVSEPPSTTVSENMTDKLQPATTTSSDGPGFSPISALLAFLLISVVAMRKRS